MKARWLWFVLCIVFGLMLLACGLLMPAHLRAVDAAVVHRAGQNTAGLLEQEQQQAGAKKLGAAQLMLQAAQSAGIPGWQKSAATWTNFAKEYPSAIFWGDDLRTGGFFNGAPVTLAFTDFIIRRDNRSAALTILQESGVPAVQSLLRTRKLTDTVLFPPSQSASGQAFDTALSICGLLIDGNHLTGTLSNNITALAEAANRGANTEPYEQALMDFVSLGQRLNWDQLVAFSGTIPDAITLHQLADQMRNAGDQLPILFAVVTLSGNASGVASYIVHYKQAGQDDLSKTLRYGSGALNNLVENDQRLYTADFRSKITSQPAVAGLFAAETAFTLNAPQPAMLVKIAALFIGGFLFAVALHFGRRPATVLEEPLEVRGFHFFREFLFSLGFLLMVILLSEPFLVQEGQKGNIAFQLHLPMAGNAVPAGIAGIKQTIMNPTILATMLVFFVLQTLLYTACIVKLAEIRRQRVPPRIKLKLLENEDHLFDAGLYLGFVGTIVSLIVASLGLIKFSLMAAYSSTSFGIVFVVIFKIFHLRPSRRQLLLESEIEAAAAARATASAAHAVPFAPPIHAGPATPAATTVVTPS